MSFATLNGWVVPLVDAQQSRLPIGDRERAFSGAILRSERAVKNNLKCRTNQMSELVAAALRGLVAGEGDKWSLNNTLYSSKGLGETGTAVKTYRAHLAADGDPVAGETPFDSGYCAAFEDANTNLFPSNVRDCSNTATGFTLVGGGSITTTTSHKWEGSNCAAWTPGGSVEIGPASVSGSTAYYVTAYLKGNRTVNVYLQDNDSGVSSPVQYALTDSEWTRVKVTLTTEASATELELVVSAVSGSGDVYIDGCQAEVTHYTSWYDGSRASPVAAAYVLPFASAQDYTIACWFAHDSTPTAVGHYVRIAYGSKYVTLYQNSSTLYGIVHDGTAQGSVTDVNITPNNGTWRHAALVCRRSPETGEATLTLYVDGTSSDTDNPGSYSVPELTSDFTVSIGGVSTASPANARMADVVILPYAAPAALIAAMAARASAWPAPPVVELAGDCIVEATRDCDGVIDNEQLVSYSDSGARRINGRVLEFTLEQL